MTIRRYSSAQKDSMMRLHPPPPGVDHMSAGFVVCRTITYSQWTNNTAQTTDSINDIVAKKPCN